MSNDNTDLADQIQAQLNWCEIGSRAWSAAHHGSLGFAAVLSAAAAVVSKLSFGTPAQRSDATAILAGIAALLATLAASGGFERKWRTNRVNRADAKHCAYE